MDKELLDAAKLHTEAVKIIATALFDCSHPTLTARDHEGNATAIIARLAHANILLERYEADKETRQEKLFAYLEQPDVLMSLPQPHRLKISELLHG